MAGLISVAGMPAGAQPAAAATAPAEQCASPGNCQVTFNFTGGAQEWIAPADVTSATVSVAGAQGGTTPDNVPGGHGALVTATVPVVAGNAYPVQVGGTSTGRIGGYGGGGNTFGFKDGDPDIPAGGGGASSFGTVSSGVALIAGGGGGGGGHGYGSHGGDGGGGGASETAGGGGETISGTFISSYGGGPGGAAVTRADGTGSGGSFGQPGVGENFGQSGYGGTLGQGGNGGGPDGDGYSGAGGGGGGGYYGGGGGGGGGAGWSAKHAKMLGGGGGGGGGGSNYVSASASDVNIVNGSNVGSGVVVISYHYRVTQTITFTSTPPDSPEFSDDYYVTATASSQLAVTFSGSGSCFVVNVNEVVFTAPGDCTVTASQAGDEFHFAAEPITQVITVVGLPQTLDFDTPTPQHPTVGDTYYVALVSGQDRNPPAAVSTTGGCTEDRRMVTFTQAGPCVVTAVGLANGNYAASAPITRTILVAAGDPPVTFTSIAPTPVVGDTHTPTVTGGAPNTNNISLYTTTSAYCTVDSGVVTFTHAGICELTAKQFSVYNDPTKQQTQIITIGAAPQAITFTSTAPMPMVGGSYTPTATGGASTMPVTFGTTGGNCTLDTTSGVVTFTHVGTCTITANQAANSDYTASPQAAQVITVQQSPAVIPGIPAPVIEDPAANSGSSPTEPDNTALAPGAIAPSEPAPASTSRLASTGANVAAIAGGGSALLLAGATLALIAHRRVRRWNLNR